MKTHTHTPGPFHITRNTTPGQFVTETKIRDKHQSVVAVLHVNSEGNGPLFSAAPELFEALEDAAFLMQMAAKIAGPMQDSFKRSAEDAAKALAKAEGRA